MSAKILIVDDEIDIPELVRPNLEKQGYVTETANNGREALGAYLYGLIKDEPFDLILLDIMMPDLSGLDVLDSIRQEEKHRGIELGHGMPILMVTALKKPFMDSFNRGCDDYIIKPFEMSDLLEKIKAKLDQ